MKCFSKLSLLALLMIQLSGCSTRSAMTVLPAGWNEYSDSQFGYFIAAPHVFARADWNGRVTRSGEKSMHALWNGILDKPGQIDIDIYHLSSADSDCNNFGISDHMKEEKTGTKSVWGKFIAPEDFPDKPFHLDCSLVSNVTRGTGYVFCSQKNEKIVLICVAQDNDDPVFAEQIFQTFNWNN